MSFISIHACGQSPGSSWPGPSVGQYAVGFQSSFIVDSTRAFFSTDRSASNYGVRPVRVYIWYPAKDTPSLAKMPFSEYVDVQSPEGLEAYNQYLVRHDRSATAGQFSPRADTLRDKLLNSKTLAIKDAPAALGQFPLILHSTGINGWQAEGSVLFEYLASHGYVVVNVPQVGARIEQPNVPYTAFGVGLQGKDLSVALDHVLSKSFVQENRIAAMGHSFGGLVALWLASQNNNIDAIVTLDGSNVIPRGIEISKQIDWWLDGVQIPVFSLHTLGSGERDLSLMRGLRYADRYFLTYPNAGHFDFQNWPLHVSRWNIADPRSQNLRPHREGAAMYRSTIQLAKLFFDATLKGESEAMKFVRGERRLPDLSDQAVFMYEETSGTRVALDELTNNGPQLLLPGVANTLRDEYGPTYSPEGNTLYFVKRRNRRGDEHIVKTQAISQGWTTPTTVSFSGEYHDKEPFISPDGQRMFFASTRPGNGSDAFDIWMAVREGSDWSEPVRLGPEVNTESVYDNYPAVAANGNLYFGSRREGSEGIDLWVSRYDNGSYLMAEHLGPVINSTATDADPYIDPMERFLIFCSTREGGEGSGDLYISYADGNGGWKEPLNLGPEINTSEFEYTPLISPDGQWLLFSRGWGEIYKIRLSEINAFLLETQ